jgi:hypothetical protein
MYRVASPIVPKGHMRSCPGRAAPRCSVLVSRETVTRVPPMLTGVSHGFGWRIHCGVAVTELSTNKQHTHTLCVYWGTQ